MPSKDELMASMMSEPWLYWTPQTRERISQLLRNEAYSIQRDIADLPWHEFPILRGHAEDDLRALNDLRRVVSLTSVEPVAVGMGEESAP